MTTEKGYEQVLVGLGTVLLLAKEMQMELIGQIEALPQEGRRDEILQELREHAAQITEEDIQNRIRSLYPEAEILKTECIESLPEIPEKVIAENEKISEEHEALNMTEDIQEEKAYVR